MRVGYLIGCYPALNHRYILTEVRQLREAGMTILTCSIAAPDRPPEKLSEAEREEAAHTYYVKRRWKEAPAAHLALAFTSPLRYLRAAVCAWRLATASPRSLLYHLAYFAQAILVARWMQRNRITHLHTNFAMTVAAIAVQACPAGMSFVAHGFGELYDPAGTKLRQKIEQAAFVRAVSRFAVAQLMLSSDPAWWGKLRYGPLGIDPRDFGTPLQFRERPEAFELICVGRLAPEKGQRVLLACMERLREEGHRVRLRLLGDGPDRSALERQAAAAGMAEAVSMPGAVDPSLLPAAYAAADIFVLPSLYEGIPIVLMEAMMMEVSCVAPRITGIPELIRDGIDGLLFTAGDASEMRDCIVRLVNSPVLRRELGRSARQRVLELYDLRENTRRFAAILEQYAGRKRGPAVAGP
jgi:glycosyltransferase involved in cell wall biosynthesis